MCIYCENKIEVDNTDDYYHAYEEIDIEKKWSLIFSIIQFGNIEWDPSIDFRVELYDDKNDKYTDLFSKEININYCPFCGRKLKES